MSRSRRKPFRSIADSAKKWKKMFHKIMRAKVRMQMHHDPESVPTIVDENAYSDVYDSPGDGRAQYVGTQNDAGTDDIAKVTRK